ncbi:uncharacterized protein N7498_000907 [Penicillium cinerascens]|uniref:AA1-like domain-containing protein n=1 Tax=Penicillium cinerascens TaxID=70096 RepID=A0A9W9TDJ1_9EURO|nr:uncharacterized protein N7498_000907 [Penicillium cinerascens]KAJ5218808.1 hypothetical protein N7498_000907 [Penicillium cinerascens]
MKFLGIIQFLSIASALASSHRRAQPLEIQGLSANQYSNITLSTLHFTVHDPSTDVTDDCNVSWNTSSINQPGLAPRKCLRGQFEFGFRYGIGNIENFTLVVQQVNGSAQGSSVVTAYRRNPDWICLQNPVQGVKERCVWNGTLSINV